MPTGYKLPPELTWGGGGDYNSKTLYGRYLQNVIIQNQRRLIDYLTGPSDYKLLSGGNTGFYLVVNDEELVRQMDRFTGNRIMFTRTINAARTQFIPRIKEILLEIIEETTKNQADGAFPIAFINPLKRAIQYIPPGDVTGNAPHLVSVQLPNLYEHLGGEDEYAAAFHHKALLPGVKKTGRFTFQERRSDIRKRPYHWEELRTQDPGQRYRYWKAMYQGKRSITVNRGNDFAREFGMNPNIEIPIEGTWKDTYMARLDAWAKIKPSGAPQWLLLEYGQPKWAPRIKIDKTEFNSKVTGTRANSIGQQIEALTGINRFSYNKETSTYSIPGNISAKWIGALSKEWSTIISSVWSNQIDQFNKTSTNAAFDRKSSRLRSAITGRFMKLGTSPVSGRILPAPSGPDDIFGSGGTSSQNKYYQRYSTSQTGAPTHEGPFDYDAVESYDDFLNSIIDDL